jgi:hypothetical protein
MPARIISLFSAVAVFFHLRRQTEEPDVDRLLLDALNKTNREWSARNAVEKSHSLSRV